MSLRPSVSEPAPGPVLEPLPARRAGVGGGGVLRALPTRGRRTVGPWCFLDHFGPSEMPDGAAMVVPPHPHTGLATVTWLLEGQVLHKDSVGSEQLIRPGQLNLMISGRGISHSEEGSPGLTHGLQLWLALPEHRRHGPPAFEHHAALPRREAEGLRRVVILGEHDGLLSPATTASPTLALELRWSRSTGAVLPLEPAFEHAVLVAEGCARVEGQLLETGSLLYLGTRRPTLAVQADAGSTLLLIGGAPFTEPLLMWWNLVARTPEEIAEQRAAWQAGDERFGSIPAYTRGPRLEAPPL